MSSMEFWGVEVKAGEPLKVTPDNDYIIHLSQAAISESKKEKGNESVPLWVKIDNKKILLGTLGTEKTPQLAFDLVFEKEFVLSHSWKNGSVYFCGYQSVLPEEEDFSGSDMDSDEEELLPIVKTENAKPLSGNELQAVVKAKPESAKLKPKAAEASKGNKADDDSDEDESGEDNSDDEDDESESEDGSGEEGMSVDESDESDESESEDEETPKKAEKGKKRANESATKTPIPSKKIKAATPQKTDGKKGGHTATPHPAKGAKTAASANGSNVKTPKSGGQFSCKSCDRSFGSDGALQSHSKAKHGGK